MAKYKNLKVTSISVPKTNVQNSKAKKITKQQVYNALLENNLFDKNINSVITFLSKILKTSIKAVTDILYQLKADKAINIKDNKKVVNLKQAVIGTFHALRDNTGLVKVEGYETEFFVENPKDALEGDTVKVYISSEDEKPTAKIEKIEKRNKRNITGRVIRTHKGVYTFIPDNKQYGDRIVIPQDETSMLALDKKCCLTLDSTFNNSSLYASLGGGKITHIFGLAGDPIAENVSIAYSYGFVKYFDEDVMKEANSIPTTVLESEIEGRLDLREHNFFTIDPRTCKDMDDAVCVEKTKTGYRVYVAIADVSHYVSKGSKIDNEAYSRGTSCYLGDGVYPMLPEILSNGICSLNENVDRLVKVVIVDLDKAGKITKYKIDSAVINSRHKLSYNDADDIHFNREDAHIKYSDVKDNIDLMFLISDILTKKRTKRGALDFANEESKFKLDDTKTNVLEVFDEHSLLESTKIIESFMILANEVVAYHFLKKEVDALFRTHKAPLLSKLNELNEVLDEFGYEPVEPTSQSYQKIIEAIKDDPNRDYLTTKILRSMDKAIYSAECTGHFGLASDNYLHFTSPIRRYPDLIVHRIIDYMIKNPKMLPTFDQLEIAGIHLSDREQCAKDAEIESNKLMKAIWAENHVGEVFHGKIFDILENGIIVKSGLVEMFIPFSDLLRNKKETFIPNHSNTKLIGNKSGFEYRIGDKLDFKILIADRISRKITATTDLQKEVLHSTYNNRDIIDEFFYKEK